jgi:uncharacterized protein (TIGR03437 family)
LVSFFGQNLAAASESAAPPWPAILGNTCVTVNNQPIPLSFVSGDQINAQIPPALAPGTYATVVRSLDRHATSRGGSVSVAKYAPSVFVDPASGQAAIYYSDGSPVTPQHPATRDQRLLLYAAGLGGTHGTLTAGQPSPASAGTTQTVSVYFGNPGYSQSPIVVEWSGLAPGMIGVYQVNLYVPGTHMNGDHLPVTIRVGGVSSPQTGNFLPYVALD